MVDQCLINQAVTAGCKKTDVQSTAWLIRTDPAWPYGTAELDGPYTPPKQGSILLSAMDSWKLIKKHKCIKKAETAKKEIPSDNLDGVLKYKRPDSEEDTQRKKKVQAKGRKGKRIFTEYDESSSPLQKKLKFRPNTGLILHMYGSRQQNAGVSWKVEWPKKWKYITITYSIDVLPQIHGHHNSDDTSIHNSPTSPLECTYYTFHLLMKLASLNPSIPGLSEYPWLSRHFSSKEDSSHRKLRDMYLFFLDKLCHKFNCKFAYVFLYLNLYDLFINN
ncbi:uncharacterized protein [Cherax quadricarinatus]|uniref:uncharacterized protein isoform X3 n=1 Tax=Cherax quadricarinatus TaxID=27406 RepID=UPI00387E436E